MMVHRIEESASFSKEMMMLPSAFAFTVDAMMLYSRPTSPPTYVWDRIKN